MEDCVVLLFHGDTAFGIWRHTTAGIHNGHFSLHAEDDGEEIRRLFGTEESEYAYSLNEEDTERFLQLIMKEGDTPETAIRRELSGEDCVVKFCDLCKQNGLNHSLLIIR